MSVTDFPDYVEVNTHKLEARTRRMPVAAAGSYMLLLGTLWSLGGGRLPLDHPQLARIAHCPEREWPKLWKKHLAKHFRVSADGLWISEKRSLLRGTR